MKTPAEIQKAYGTLKADNEARDYEDAVTYGLEQALAWVIGGSSHWGDSLDGYAKGERQYDGDGSPLN